MNRQIAIETLREGREALGLIARHVKLSAGQMSRVARADKVLENGIKTAEQIAEDRGLQVLRTTASIGAGYLFSLATDLPDSEARERLIEWNAHFELLARNASEVSHDR